MTLAPLLLLIGIGTFVDEPARPVPVPITGTVVDADRKPAAGTGVYFSSLNAGNGWGGVIARMATDAQGRFRLEVPGAPGGGPKPGILWAYRPGALVASRWVTRETLPPDLPVVMVLDHPAHSEFLIRGPDGRPVAGARIEPRVLNREFFAVPDGLAEQIAARTVTDARGRAVLSAFFPEEVGTIIVTAPGLGSQQFGFGHGADKVEARTIDLRPVGRVEGRIVSDDAAVMRDNRKLSVVVWDQKLGPPALGLLYLATDPQGRFMIPEAPVGGLGAYGIPTAGSPWFLQSTAGLKVEAGQTTRVEVKPLKGIRLTGVVRERGTGRPIAGVGVGVLRPGAGEDDSVRTDAEGRFELFAQPGQPQVSVRSLPEGFASLHFVLEAPKVADGALAATVPPIELSRAGNVRGVVVDDRGEPVVGATVLASWPVNEGPNRSGRRDTRATTGPRGEFLVERVVAEVTAELSAIAPDGRRTAQFLSTPPGAEPVTLALRTSTAVSLAGRVVDARGHRVADARVHLRVQSRYPSGQVKGDALVEIRGAYVILTRDDGWFRTPPVLDPALEYAAIAEADGFDPARTGWTIGKARTFPELVLQPKASDRPVVEARVLDRDGRPVAGADVWTPDEKGVPLRATIDAQGRFRFAEVPPRRSFLFVEAAGYRFHGQVIQPGARLADVKLARSGEPRTSRMTTLPPPQTRKEERAMASRLFLNHAERAVKKDDESTRLSALEVLAQVDPARVLELIETRIFANPWYNDYLRRACAKALWEDSHEEALAVVEAMQSPEWRAQGHLDACDALPSTERKARLEQVDQALLQARAISEGDHRVQTLGQIAEHYLDLGEVEKGTKLLRETLPAARELPREGWGGYARGSFAEELAQVDRAAALQLIREVGERETLPDRHRLNMAQELASRDPAQAEWLLTTLKDQDQLVRALPRICHAMALKDPDRARQFADRDLGKVRDAQAIPFARAHALGMIALAIADTDKSKAARFLDEAFAVLKSMAAEGRPGPLGTDAAIVAAALLPVAERIDPARVPEYFWRAASFHGSSKPQRGFAAPPDAMLALLLARYDRDPAMVLLQPILDRGPKAEEVGAAGLVEAMAAVDPARAVAVVESLPDDPDIAFNPFKNPKNNARRRLAALLAGPPAKRWETFTHRLLHLWIVGEEDIF